MIIKHNNLYSKNTTSNHENTIHAAASSFQKTTDSVNFSGYNQLSGKLLKSAGKHLAAIEKKNSQEIYNKIKDYLDEPIKLVFEKALKSYKNKTPDIIIADPLYNRFKNALISPFVSLTKGIKYLFSNSQVKNAIKEQDKINEIIKGLGGAYKSIIKLEGKPSEEIKKALSDSLTQKLNAVKTNYSINQAGVMIRLLAGVLSGVFIANDFSNLRRLSNDDPAEAKKEWKSKFKQYMTGVGISAYLGYLTSTTFKQAVNTSIKFAVGLNVLNLVSTEIMSRKITGRPVFIEKDIVTDDSAHLKHYMKSLNNNQANTPFTNFVNNSNQQKAHSVEAKTENKKQTQLAFGGFAPQKLVKTLSTIKRDKFINLMKLLEKVDPERYNKVIDVVQKGFEKLSQYKDTKVIDIIEKGAFPEITQIPVGKNALYNFATRGGEALILPFNLIAKLAKKIFSKKASVISSKADKTTELSSVFVKNTLNLVEKAKKISVGAIADKDLLEKIKADNGLLNKLKENYGSFFMDFLSAEKAAYDSSKANTLFKLTGLAAVPFLVMDVYNLTKKEGGDDELSFQKARERAAQDLTRQGFSTWIVAGVNSIFKEFFNKSLLGAALVTTGSVLGYESFTRASVGVPILPKSKKELEEIDIKNFNKKGISAACFRIMSRLTGKKPLTDRKTAAADLSKSTNALLKNNLFTEQPNNPVTTHQHTQNFTNTYKASIDLNNSLVPDRFKNN